MKKNILVLGGSGFLGKNICEVLRKQYNIIVFSKESIPASDHKSYQGDFSNPKDLEMVFKENKIDIVLHLISTTTPATSNKDKAYDIKSNLLATIDLLDLMVKYSVPKIVFISSGGGVYGKLGNNEKSVKEDHATNPLCSYAICKLAIEKYLLLYKNLHNIDYLILRVSNPYGEHHSSDSQGIINIMLKKIVAGDKIEIWGDGSVIRDYIYVKDCANIVKTLLDKETFNIQGFKRFCIQEKLAHGDAVWQA